MTASIDEPKRLLDYDIPADAQQSFALTGTRQLTGAYVGSVSAYKHDDAAETVVLVFKAPGEQDNAIYLLDRAGTLTRIDRTESGKDGGGAAVVYRDGSVRLIVAEADPGQSGSTAALWLYDVPSKLPPAVADGADSVLAARVAALEAALAQETRDRKGADAWLRDIGIVAAVKEAIRAAFVRAMG